jgi:hypothetical protein
MLPGEAADERDGNEHGREDQRDPDHRRGDLLHGLERRVTRAHAVLDVVHDRLDHDDGVVHHDADREHETEHRQRVDREAEQREEDEGADDRTGTVSSGMIVARIFCRKMNTTIVTRISASTKVFTISWMEACTAGVVS